MEKQILLSLGFVKIYIKLIKINYNLSITINGRIFHMQYFTLK